MFNINPATPRQEQQVSYIVDADGFLINADDWTEAFAAQVLDFSSSKLSAQHYDVLEYVRTKYLYYGSLPPLRFVCHSTGIEKKELKSLFGSCIQMWRAAGLPNPDDEVRAYMG